MWGLFVWFANHFTYQLPTGHPSVGRRVRKFQWIPGRQADHFIDGGELPVVLWGDHIGHTQPAPIILDLFFGVMLFFTKVNITIKAACVYVCSLGFVVFLFFLIGFFHAELPLNHQLWEDMFGTFSRQVLSKSKLQMELCHEPHK